MLQDSIDLWIKLTRFEVASSSKECVIDILLFATIQWMHQLTSTDDIRKSSEAFYSIHHQWMFVSEWRKKQVFDRFKKLHLPCLYHSFKVDSIDVFFFRKKKSCLVCRVHYIIPTTTSCNDDSTVVFFFLHPGRHCDELLMDLSLCWALSRHFFHSAWYQLQQ